jgi:hypothetical protein
LGNDDVLGVMGAGDEACAGKHGAERSRADRLDVSHLRDIVSKVFLVYHLMCRSKARRRGLDLVLYSNIL